jgi:hypothetical protein
MTASQEDVFTEPRDIDPNTLANLGPLTAMAGLWQGKRGVDVHPERTGANEQVFVETIELQPIDPQTNGPQLFYGLRYHIHVVRPGEKSTFHDQIGYWLWEPATETVIQTLTIPRGQTALALGHASADARTFELKAQRGSELNGICSNPFLDGAFKTVEYGIRVTINDDGTWSYQQNTVLLIRGQTELFHHTDHNTLEKLAEPTPNPGATLKA